MKLRRWMSLFWILLFILGTLVVQASSSVKADLLAQIPTVAIPTVTGTPPSAIAIVTMEQDQINVRGGPSTDYPIVGVLIAGQQVPALGRSVGGDWIQIVYPGVSGGVAWVYSPLVTLQGSLPVVEPPPTPTPRTTPTIDPTLAAQFIIEIPPTRLPTFTPPGPLVVPSFSDANRILTPARVPMGLIIVGMAVLGFFGMMISFLRGR